MISKEQIVELMVDKAIAYLDYDDAHPDVGMGMFTSTAIDYAEKDIVEEAARWNSLAALSLNFTNEMREQATIAIKQRRRR